MSAPETLEQMAERLAVRLALGADTLRHNTGLILAALREVEARGEQRAAALGGTLLDSAIERAEKATALAAERMELLTVAVNTGAAAYKRAEKADAEVARLKEMLRHYGMVCDNPDQCLLDDDTKEQP